MFSSIFKLKGYKISCIKKTKAMKGKTVSLGERKISLNVFKQFKIENSSLSCKILNKVKLILNKEALKISLVRFLAN